MNLKIYGKAFDQGPSVVQIMACAVTQEWQNMRLIADGTWL